MSPLDAGRLDALFLLLNVALTFNPHSLSAQPTGIEWVGLKQS